MRAFVVTFSVALTVVCGGAEAVCHPNVANCEDRRSAFFAADQAIPAQDNWPDVRWPAPSPLWRVRGEATVWSNRVIVVRRQSVRAGFQHRA